MVTSHQITADHAIAVLTGVAATSDFQTIRARYANQKPLIELDEPADVHVPDSLEAERRQRALDGDSLRIEDAGLGPDEHARPHAPVRSSQALNGSPVMSSYACT